MKKIFEEIKREMNQQDKKWGVQNHTMIEWIAILTEEVGEAAKEANDYCFANPNRDLNLLRPILVMQDGERKLMTILQIRRQNYRMELIQAASVAIQAIRNLDRIDNSDEFKNLT